MAVTRTKGSVAMLLTCESGVNSEGATTFKTITLNRVNPAASDDDIFAVGSALGALQVFPVAAISVRTVDILVNG